MKKIFSLFLIFLLFTNTTLISYAENESYSIKEEIIERNGQKCIQTTIENAGKFQYSPDGKSFAFLAIKNDKQIVFKDGIESKEYDGVYSSTYSPDGKSFAFIAKKNGKDIIVKDLVELGKEYDNINEDSLIYSPDGKSFAYLAKKDGKIIMVKDGIELGKEYDSIRDFIYSPDGKSFAFLAKKDGKYIIVKDGIEINNVASNIGYSPDGKSFAFLAKKDGKYIIVKDGIESNQYDNIYDFKYSPDGKSFSFITEKKGKEIIVKDLVEIDKYDKVGKFKYSPDGKSFAFIVIKDFKITILGDGNFKEDGKSFIVKDGVEGKEYDSITEFIFSPDGKSFAFIAKKNGKYIIIKDLIELGKEYDNILDFKYSPDGKSFAFKAEKDGKSFIVKDGIESKEYNYIDSMIYSPDGKSFAFKATKNGKEIIVKDGIESKEYDKIKNFIFFPDGKSFIFEYIKDGKNFILKETCDSGNGDINQETNDIKIDNNKIETDKNINTEDKKNLLKEKVFLTLKIKKLKQEKYLSQIDKIVNKTDNVRLEKILSKIDKIENKGNIVKYLEISIKLKLGLYQINTNLENGNKDILQKNNEVSLVTEAKNFDKINNINRVYGDENDNILKGIDNQRNIIWGKQGKDTLQGGKLDDIIILVGDMSKYGKTDTKQTLEFLGFKIEEINGKNFNISGSPKVINGKEGRDILFITGDINLTNTEMISIEDVIIH